MPAKNVVTAAIDGFFELISTGYVRVDKVVKNLVKIAVLLFVVIASVTSVVDSLNKIGSTASRMGVVVAEESAAPIKAASKLISPSEVTEADAETGEVPPGSK
jgi:hypothetical protein